MNTRGKTIHRHALLDYHRIPNFNDSDEKNLLQGDDFLLSSAERPTRAKHLYGRYPLPAAYSFINDYSEGAHPSILEWMLKTNAVQEDGYGNDSLSQQAAALLKQQMNNPAADVHFISGGTQANLLAMACMLRPYECVIAATSAHINVHEAGAIEATGHKIDTVPSTDGKITPEQIQTMVDERPDEHMVKPKAVFISNSTEVGTIYRKAELEAIAEVCRRNNLYLYMDGARLGCGLTSAESDLTLPEVSRLVDMFYVGGTKNGALLGEAMVINRSELKTDFRYLLKQRGALLAKGRLIGVQFLALFQNDLYFTLARHSNAMAQKIAARLGALGYPFLTHSTTNQIFPILPNDLIRALQERYAFYTWSKVDDSHSSVRVVTSWATPEIVVDEFLAAATQLSR